MAAFTRRQYAGAAASTTITGAINATDTTVGIAATTGWPSAAGVPFYVVIDPGTSSEEKCSATISGSTLTLTRAQDDTTGKSHSSGATIYPVFTANDADEANELVAKLTTKGDLLVTDGSALNRLAVGANTTFLKANSGATNGVEWDAIDLGTDTTGNYVATIAGTSNQITVSGSGSESAAVTLSTPQDIHTGATPTFAGAILSGSSSSDLLRITQTGAGNALLVEDSTNPDSTPFVIDASGRLVVGNTATVTSLSGVVPSIQSVGAGASASSLLGARYSADVNGPSVYLSKSRSATVGSETVVAASDRLGNMYFTGSDGTNQILGASISVEAEGTVSTGVVPGRLLFFTSGSTGTATERMRIDSNGSVGIGATPTAARTLSVSRAITGSTNAVGVLSNGITQSDVTSGVQMYRSFAATTAASFTLAALSHFYAAGLSTPGSGSTITDQYGFIVDNALTGATNNYAFHSNVGAATGRWNLYMTGTAANYMAGRLGVGATLTSGAMAQITNTTAAEKALVVKGAASQTGNLLDVQNSAGTTLFRIDSGGITYDFGSNVNTETVALQLANGRTGDGFTYIDFVGDATYTDYGLRIIRNNTGVNTASTLAHRGTGDLRLRVQDAGFLTVYTSDIERMRIDSAGNLLVGMTTIATSSAKTIHLANATVPTANPTGGGVLYVESGALKYRGSSGTVTTIANA